MEETEQLQQARSDSDISENQEEQLVREFCGLEVREQKMKEELSAEWKDVRIRLSNLICHIDGQMASLSAEEKRMEERRDESYWNGVQDLYEAVKNVAAEIEDDGMATKDMEKYFGEYHIAKVICKNDPKTIMEKVNEWKADKERAQKEDKEFRVGDEVVCKATVPDSYSLPKKGIITAINHEYLNTVWVSSATGNLLIYNVYADNYKKTGRHFDSIPFTYGQEESDAE